jgi:hypothetical protein
LSVGGWEKEKRKTNGRKEGTEGHRETGIGATDRTEVPPASEG